MGECLECGCEFVAIKTQFTVGVYVCVLVQLKAEVFPLRSMFMGKEWEKEKITV